MGKSRRRSGPKVKFVQPGWRHRAPAAPPTAGQRAARLSPSQVLEKITRAPIARDEAEAELAALIDHAVALGVGWRISPGGWACHARRPASTTTDGTAITRLSTARITRPDRV